MVSLDEPERNREFAESVSASFVLLSDPGKENAKRYGVLVAGGLYTRRWTFYIDLSGDEAIVRRIDKKVDPSTHGEDVVRSLEELGFPRRDTQPSSAGNAEAPAAS